ncbi:hypothetical protein M2138_000414 [Dysgonomonadaceae bacterium PH5-43]|nr:hypothetical protein [Dysgonomonadaceae bacterium PH5-43]
MKKIIIFAIVSMSVFSLKSQTSFISPSQEMIEYAIKDGIYLVEQRYRLKNNEDGKYYGRNNKSEFGKVYSIAVKLNAAYCIDEMVFTPWKLDDNYTSLSEKEKEQYTPVLYKSNYRKIFHDNWNNFPLDTLNSTEIINGMYSLTDEKGEFGLQIDVAEGLKKGWLVWVTTQDDSSKQDTIDLNLIVYRSEINITQDKGICEINQPVFPANIMGGIYIVPEVTRIGQVTFFLTGMIKNIDDKWVVVSLYNAKKGKNISDDLTPIEDEEPLNKPRKMNEK